MIDFFINLISNDYVLAVVFTAIIVIPIVAFVVYELQPEWYKQDQQRKYAKVTLILLILCALVAILELLGVLK